jgi:hypothetical protein
MMKAPVLKKRKKKERDKQDKNMFIQKTGQWKSRSILKYCRRNRPIG